MSYQLVSVIIPVFNDSERLKVCLDALQSQTYQNEYYEVIVVDNGSDKVEDIKNVVNQFSQAFLTYESQSGSYAARNKGISLAKGAIIAFTDADCIPAYDWIEKGVINLLKKPNSGLLGGKIKIFFQDPDHPTSVELYENIYAFPQKKYVEQLRFSATANLFTFKSVIDTIGLFDATLKSGGDFDWGKRVFLAGYEQIYSEDVCVNHPARYSFNELESKIRRVTCGHHNLKNKNRYSIKAFLITLYFDLKKTVKSLVNVCRIDIDNDKLNGWQQKVQVMFVVLFVGITSVKEKIKLYSSKLKE